MKKLLLTFLCVMTAITSFAQFQRGPVVVSPQFNGDGSITFRYRAPKAVSVQLSGDICPLKEIQTPQGVFNFPMPLDMKEGANGIWEIT
ncbi:MAG: esterase, partial [Bacteroidales bacterium]|nr:esterase [Bacteroidales bacterium]